MIVLDTHVWIWWTSSPDNLSPRVREALEVATSEDRILISSISAWEVVMLTQRGRLKLDRDVKAWIALTESMPFVRFVPVDNEIAILSLRLPNFHHKDPADRIITATAVKHSAILATKDGKLLEYPHVRTLW